MIYEQYEKELTLAKFYGMIVSARLAIEAAKNFANGAGMPEFITSKLKELEQELSITSEACECTLECLKEQAGG